MVHLATRTSGRSPQSPYKTESATVMLEFSLQSAHEIGQAGLALALEPLGGEDKFEEKELSI